IPARTAVEQYGEAPVIERPLHGGKGVGFGSQLTFIQTDSLITIAAELEAGIPGVVQVTCNEQLWTSEFEIAEIPPKPSQPNTLGRLFEQVGGHQTQRTIDERGRITAELAQCTAQRLTIASQQTQGAGFLHRIELITGQRTL